MGCEIDFSMFTRRHHCRSCGNLYCRSCASHRAPVPGLAGDSHRVCTSCFSHLQEQTEPGTRSSPLLLSPVVHRHWHCAALCAHQSYANPMCGMVWCHDGVQSRQFANQTPHGQRPKKIPHQRLRRPQSLRVLQSLCPPPSPCLLRAPRPPRRMMTCQTRGAALHPEGDVPVRGPSRRRPGRKFDTVCLWRR